MVLSYVETLEKSLTNLQAEHDRIETRLQKAKAMPGPARACPSSVSRDLRPSHAPQTPSSVQVGKKAPPDRFFGEENAMG